MKRAHFKHRVARILRAWAERLSPTPINKIIEKHELSKFHIKKEIHPYELDVMILKRFAPYPAGQGKEKALDHVLEISKLHVMVSAARDMAPLLSLRRGEDHRIYIEGEFYFKPNEQTKA